MVPKGIHDLIKQIKKDLKREFKIKKLSEVQKILDIYIVRRRSERAVYLNQSNYIKKFLYQFNIKHKINRPTDIPVNNQTVFRKTLITDEVTDQRDYQRRTKNIIFTIIFTRPNICLALSKLSQYISNPAKHHETAIKHILRYLRSNSDLCIRYGLI